MCLSHRRAPVEGKGPISPIAGQGSIGDRGLDALTERWFQSKARITARLRKTDGIEGEPH